jgi:hypothetical protein
MLGLHHLSAVEILDADKMVRVLLGESFLCFPRGYSKGLMGRITRSAWGEWLDEKAPTASARFSIVGHTDGLPDI